MSKPKLLRSIVLEIVVGVLILLLLAVIWRSPSVAQLRYNLSHPTPSATPGETQATPTPTPVRTSLQIKAGDLSGGIDQVRSGEYATLIVFLGGEGTQVYEVISYPDLYVSDVLDAEGRDITWSGSAPDKLSLQVRAADHDLILLALQGKKAAYLQTQGKSTATPTPTSTPTPLPMPTGTPTPTPEGETVVVTPTVSPLLLSLPVDDLVNDPRQIARQVSPGELVSLVFLTLGDDDKTPKSVPYYNLRVERVLDAGQSDVALTRRTPHTLLLSVPNDKRDDILVALKDETKKAMHLQFQGPEIVAPTDTPTPVTPTPTTTVSPGHLAFVLPRDKIESDLDGLEKGSAIEVIVVVGIKEQESEDQTYAAFGPYDATLLDLIGADGNPLEEDHKAKDVTSIRVSLPVTTDDKDRHPAVEFAAHFEGAVALYIQQD